MNVFYATVIASIVIIGFTYLLLSYQQIQKNRKKADREETNEEIYNYNLRVLNIIVRATSNHLGGIEIMKIPDPIKTLIRLRITHEVLFFRKLINRLKGLGPNHKLSAVDWARIIEHDIDPEFEKMDDEAIQYEWDRIREEARQMGVSTEEHMLNELFTGPIPKEEPKDETFTKEKSQ